MRKVLNDSLTPPGKKRILYLLNKLIQLRPSSGGNKSPQSTVDEERPEEDGGNGTTAEEVT